MTLMNKYLNESNKWCRSRRGGDRGSRRGGSYQTSFLGLNI
jgi:hypothetical protein